MKLRGVVKGTTIELEADPELPDGQRVVVELEIQTAGFNADPLAGPDLKDRIATDPNLESIQQTRSLRDRIATRLEGNLLNSLDLIREDRGR